MMNIFDKGKEEAVPHWNWQAPKFLLMQLLMCITCPSWTASPFALLLLFELHLCPVSFESTVFACQFLITDNIYV